MKQHFSVLMLAARGTIYKVIGILLLLVVSEAALFYRMLIKLRAGEQYGLEQVFSDSRIPLACGICFLLLCAVLSLNGCELFGSKVRYTMQRLSITERTAVFWNCVNNIICFVVFWGVQLAVVFVLCRFYTAAMANVSGQTIFLAFYRSGFLHSLLPLEELSLYIRNILLILGLGITSACFSFRQRHNQKGVAIIALALITVAAFPRDMGSLENDIMIGILTLGITAGAVYGIRRGQTNET